MGRPGPMLVRNARLAGASNAPGTNDTCDVLAIDGLPRVNERGTLLEGIALWGALKPQLTQEALAGKGSMLFVQALRPRSP